MGGVKDDSLSHLGIPDDVDASIELQDWLFALEGVQEMAEMCWFEKEDLGREHRCWHMTFQSLTVKAKSSSKDVRNFKKNSHGMRRYPVEFILVRIFFTVLLLLPCGRAETLVRLNGYQPRHSYVVHDT